MMNYKKTYFNGLEAEGILMINAIAAYPILKLDFKEVGNGFLVEWSYAIQKLSFRKKDVGKDVGKASEQEVYSLLMESPSMIIPDIALRLNLTERKSNGLS